MTNKYSMDLAFSSSTQVGGDPTDRSMLAVGYGWARSVDGGPWKKEGQGLEEVPLDAMVYVTLYDCQPTYLSSPPYVTCFELTFNRTDERDPESPFLGWTTNSIHVPFTPGSRLFGPETPESTGCNVLGHRCQLSFGSLDYFNINPKARRARYNCTVKFTVFDSGEPKTFRIDPQMIVGDG